MYACLVSCRAIGASYMLLCFWGMARGCVVFLVSRPSPVEASDKASGSRSYSTRVLLLATKRNSANCGVTLVFEPHSVSNRAIRH